MVKEGGGLSKGERDDRRRDQRGQRLHYCVIAHGAWCASTRSSRSSRKSGGDQLRKADISPRQRAMLDFAMKVALRSCEIEEADFAACGGGVHRRGRVGHRLDRSVLRDEQSDRERDRDAANDEFYMMGRAPKARAS